MVVDSRGIASPGSSGRLLVLSSNADLLYDETTGGTLTTLDPVTVDTDTMRLDDAINVRSFGGDLALARTEAWGAAVPDAEACGTAIDTPRAVFATRGSNTLNVVAEDAPDAGSSPAPPRGRAAGSPSGRGSPIPSR